MADAYVERVMQWGKSGELDPIDSSRRLAVHDVRAAHVLIWTNDLTKVQYKTKISATLADEVEIDQLVQTVIDAGPKTADEHRQVDRIGEIFMLAETRAPGFATPSDVRDKLGLTNPPDPPS
ncbi:MAG: hypothetical protein ACXABY_00485 [Candidatus Thorarchaeota archaeon]|jgi:hypothetical protein